jgi:tripartite-type tricarboxylate transporter receptor subunit TctC
MCRTISFRRQSAICSTAPIISCFITALPVIDLINTGKLRALAVTAPKRLAALPEVPTVAEQGHPGLAVEDWSVSRWKSGTPDDVVNLLNSAINKALTKSKVREPLQSSALSRRAARHRPMAISSNRKPRIGRKW